MTDPGWDHYRSLRAVLDGGSLSAAARRLGLTQPTVGHHIAALEAALGVPLFTRSPRGLTPTETALALRPHAEAMALAAAALERTASGGAGELSGHVRISASDVVGGLVLPRILADMRRALPGIVVELAPSNLSADLLRQEADIAVRMVRPSQGALVAKFIGEVGLGFYATRDYLNFAGTPTSLAEIAEQGVIGPDRDMAALRGLAGAADLSGFRFVLRVDSQVAQMAAIRAGIGIGVCQHALAAEDPDLVPLLPDLFRPMLPVWLVRHEDLRASRRIQAVFDFLARALGDYVARGRAAPDGKTP
ncbi:LysR family transcriptional regulator [Zavarzinia compransoris]|uniref:LysR family transcriptional regulator n=1 Tax=Zavarzinia marina TaxID=2911065 RepID=UPI001F2E6A74|nr:LysR family transcriptional regulator [Zavarzinia marina]MCF4167194.1 LysR family transcriptional regulator [Zavarzinia marina]